MQPTDIAILVAGGLVAGIVNTLAGGGSLLTVPLLVLIGLPGTVANGTNRVGILVQNALAVRSFSAAGVGGMRETVPVLIPVLVGSVVGAVAIAQLTDEAFEKVFGVMMLLIIVPTLRSPRNQAPVEPWSPRVRFAVFFAIGLYGGAIQAGVGIALLVALTRAGFDLVRANAIKVAVVGALTAVAVPVFILEGQVAWLPASALAVGFAGGGWAGAQLAVRGGERLIRPVLVLAVLALAGRMLGLY